MDEKRINEGRKKVEEKLKKSAVPPAPKKTAASRQKPLTHKNEQLGEHLNYATKEAFKRLRTNLLLALDDGEEKACRIIGVTSAQPSEGKSTIAVNTAYSLAELGKKVLVVDADMRRPSIHAKMGMKMDFGLSNLLGGANELRAAIQSHRNSTGSVTFDVIASGSIPENPSEILNSDRMVKLLDTLSKVYDIIILDLPPVGAVIDAISVGKSTDGMIVVIRENNCPVDVFDDCIEQLRFAEIRILGFAVNGAMEGAGKGYQYKYKY